jgi:hypothetical protein
VPARSSSLSSSLTSSYLEPARRLLAYPSNLLQLYLDIIISTGISMPCPHS